MATLDQCIVDACKKSWESEYLKGTKNKNNCSGFVKAVAQQLGASLPATADADGIIDALAETWQILSDGPEAARRASVGELVIAGLKSSDHTPPRNNGHVAIVVSGELYRHAYPKCWCGSIGAAQSQGEKSVGEVWNHTDRDNVTYYGYQAAVCKK